MPRAKSEDHPLVVNAQLCAQLLGVNGAALKELEGEGLPKAKATGPQGGARYDLCQVHTWALRRREQHILESADQQRLQSLERERARLTRAQSEKTELDVARAKRELVPVELAVDPVRVYLKSVADELTALPLELKKRLPQLTSTDLDVVRHVIARIQNDCAELPDRIDLGAA